MERRTTRHKHKPNCVSLNLHSIRDSLILQKLEAFVWPGPICNLFLNSLKNIHSIFKHICQNSFDFIKKFTHFSHLQLIYRKQYKHKYCYVMLKKKKAIIKIPSVTHWSQLILLKVARVIYFHVKEAPMRCLPKALNLPLLIMQ